MPGMAQTTWIVVADGARGRVFSTDARDDEIDDALPYEFVGSRQPTRERVTDRAGQTLERHGPGGHAKSKSQDAKEHDQENLAREIADAMRSGRTDHRFDNLVLIAPPAFLGRLRTALDGPTAKLVTATHAKDLSGLPPHDLRARLRELLS